MILWLGAVLVVTFVAAMVGREVPGAVVAILIGLMFVSGGKAIWIVKRGKG